MKSPEFTRRWKSSTNKALFLKEDKDPLVRLDFASSSPSTKMSQVHTYAGKIIDSAQL